jgi:NADH-quinone oxidoreductase subunit E
MLDGVGWAALEIVVFMVAATLIGFAIGWVFVGWLQRRSIAEEYESELSAQQELARKAEHRLSENNKSLDKLHLELKGERQKVGELEAQLETMRETVADLESSTAAADAAADLATASAELDKANAELTDAKATLEDCAAARDGLSARVGELEAVVAARDATVAELEADLAAALVQPEPVAPSPLAAPIEPVPAALAAAGNEPTKEQGLARIAEIATRTSGGAPAADDDLKLVHGIGPKLERTLKGLGITSFRQIASFESDDIAFVTVALDAFKGRIERDDWMSSAAAEHAKKYNEPV